MSRLRYGSTPPALLILLLLALVPARAPAQELSGFWGGQYTPGLGEGTYSYAFQYLHNLDDNFVATFTWLNEGHVTNHHRDGHSIQLWYRWLTPDRRLTFSAGLGPYRYYDTTIPEGSTQSTDAHGFGVMASAAVSWYYQYPWVATLRYNYSYTTTSITTHTLQIGIGYQFDAWTRAGPVVPPAIYGFAFPQRDQLTGVLGRSIHNNFNSPTGTAWSIEYRHSFTPYIDATATWIDEGDTGTIKRRGVAVEACAVREFLDHRASVGLGLGPYFTYDQNETGDTTKVLGLMSMTAAYRWTPTWSVRGFWHRTVTTNGRDTDVIMFGVGYSF